MSAHVIRYGSYCPTCYQFVAYKDRREAPVEELSRKDLCKFRKAFAEVYGLNPRWVRRWGIRPGISALAGQVMANMIREYGTNRVAVGEVTQ